MFDFAQLAQDEKAKQQSSNSNGGGESLGYKVVYPFENGRLEFKFIANEKSNSIYREIHQHEFFENGRKRKVPCLNKHYGVDCPICNAVRTVQDFLGRDSNEAKGVFRNYGYKTRGIAFAKLVGHEPDNYFTRNSNNTNNNMIPVAGEIVLYMCPKSALSKLSDIITEYDTSVLEELFGKNTGKQSNGFPAYDYFLTENKYTVCDDETAFANLSATLPDLNDVKVPKEMTDDMLVLARTVSESIYQKYMPNSEMDSFNWKYINYYIY